MKETAPEKRAEALALLSAGKTTRETAKETGLSLAVVGRLRSGVSDELERIGTKNNAVAGGIFSTFLSKQFAALNAYSEHTSKEDYVRQHNPRDIAELVAAVGGNTFKSLEFALRAGFAPATPTGTDE